MAELPAPPIEPNISVSAAFTDICYLNCGKKKVHSDSLFTYVQAVLPGVGNVDILEILVTYLLPSDGDYVYVGMKEKNGAATARQLAMRPGNIAAVANNMTKGVKHETSLMHPHFGSRQITPASSQLQMLDLCFEKTEGAILTLVFHVKVNGTRSHNVNLE
jgi:hypothetical protein